MFCYNESGEHMKETCCDLFKELNLPFETYLYQGHHHDEVIHEEMEIIWVIKGSAKITVDDRTYQMDEHTIFLIYMYKKHKIESDDDTMILGFRLKKTYLHKHNLFFEKIHFNERVYTFDELSVKYKEVPLLIIQIVRLLVSNETSSAIRYKINGYYHMYILDLYRMILKERYLDVKHINNDDYLNRIHVIVEYTYQHFHEKITLNDIAKLVDISEYRLSHFVKESLGIPYREFLQTARFEHALKLLKETKLPVSEVSKLSGFSDHKYLNQMMKERFNQSPLKYRNDHACENVCVSEPEAYSKCVEVLKTCIKNLDQGKFKHLFEMSKEI